MKFFKLFLAVLIVLLPINTYAETIMDFTYDGDGGMTTSWSAKESKKFVGKRIETSSINGKTENLYMGNTRIGKQIKGHKFYEHRDHVGSIVSVTDEKGNLVVEYDYDPFGKLIKTTKHQETRLYFQPGFAQHPYIEEVGLVKMGVRFYDPDLGRFLQPDKYIPDHTKPQAFNRYAYALNNPINRVDPSGHWSFKTFFANLLGAAVAVVAAAVLGPGGAIGVMSSLGAWAVGGAIGGAVSGAITGGTKGAAWGALTGLVGGAVGGALQMAGAAFGSGLLLKGVAAAAMIHGVVKASKSGTLDAYTGGMIGNSIGNSFVKHILNKPNLKTPEQVKAQKVKDNRALTTNESGEFDAGIRIWKQGEYGKELEGVIYKDGRFVPAPSGIPGKRTVVLGSRGDLYDFLDNPVKYDVLDPRVDWSENVNEWFVKSAAKNGNPIIILRDPETWNTFTETNYGAPSRLKLEQQWLNEAGASNVSELY